MSSADGDCRTWPQAEDREHPDAAATAAASEEGHPRPVDVRQDDEGQNSGREAAQPASRDSQIWRRRHREDVPQTGLR